MSTVDQGIKNLKYDANNVLAFNGETISTFVPKEGVFEEDKFMVTTKTRKSVENELFDISTVTAIGDRIYPGSVLLANQKLMENLPTEVACNKNTVKIRLNNLPGFQNGEDCLTIDNPSASSVLSEIGKVSTLWLDKYSAQHDHNTILVFEDEMLYSENQLVCSFGLEAKKLSKSLNIKYSHKDVRQTYICRVKQIYYSATLDAPIKPSSLIDETKTTWEDLQGKGVRNETPPTYVSNVDFGRILYVKFETNDTSNKVEQAFSALIMGADISQNAEFENIIKNSKCSMVVVGGSVKEFAGSESIKKIPQIINDGLKFSKSSPGYPISYTTTFLKDNEIAVVKTRTDYIETSTTVHTNGEIKLKHTGGYVAKFNISWDEFSYDEKGNEVISRVNWGSNEKHRTAKYETVISLSANVRNISVKAEGKTGLAWEPWRTSINKKNIPLIKSRLFEIWGTTLNQKSNINPDVI